MTSKLLSLFVVCLLVASAFAGPAAAVESDATIPDESEVGSDFEATFELTELYDNFEEWTLEGETELENATWTVRFYDQAGNQIDSTETGSLSEDVDIDDNVHRIEVRVVGTTPAVENYSYDPPQQFVAANLTQTGAGGSQSAIASYGVHHYTAESKDAREAIDSAKAAVEGSSSDSGQALLQSAISSYETEDFQSAIRDANSAEEEATQNRLLRNAAMGVGGLVVLLLLVAGGYRLYKSRQQSPSRLR